MRFRWDPAKNARNVRERGLNFAEAAAMWESPMLVWTDNRQDYGEVREMALGMVGPRVMVVGWVRRSDMRGITCPNRIRKRSSSWY